MVPYPVRFADPEVAHIGLTESEARTKYGDAVDVRRWDMSHCDRAVCEDDTERFLKLVFKKDGTLLGATMVASRAGEAITELTLAIKHGWKASDLASTIHPYPTYSTAIQQLFAEVATQSALTTTSGKLATNLFR